MNRALSLSVQAIAALSLFVLSPVAGAQPVFPEPAGLYEVGRVDLDLLDNERPELFTEANDDQRRLLVSLYYPAEVAEGTAHGSYAPEYFTAAAGFTTEQIAWPSPGYVDVPMREGRYPVLVFSPGFGSMTALYSSLLYTLASEGYVIAALWHPYSTNITAFPDGSVMKRNEAGTPKGSTDEEQMAELERVGGVWVADIRFVIDQLQARNDADPFLHGHLDLNRIGAFGHSLGGASALQAAYEDERIDAAINMDGEMFGDAARKGSRVPFLFLASDPPPPSDEQLSEWQITRAMFDANDKQLDEARDETLHLSADATLQTLAKSRHNTYFTDALFLSPQEQRSGTIGDADPSSAFEQIRTWISDFMATYVRAEAAPLP